MAWPTEVEDHDAGLVVVALDRSCLLGREVLREGKSHGGESADLEKFTAGVAAAT